MTLLNTLSNFGGTYPQYFILRLVDLLTVAECRSAVPTSPEVTEFTPFSCHSRALKQSCVEAHGECVMSVH
jgi:hypothetical protein